MVIIGERVTDRIDEERMPTQQVHPHALLVAERWHLPVTRLAYLDDPDQIEEYAQIMVRRRERWRRRWLRLYWSLFYGVSALLIAAGLLFSVIFVAVAVLWLILLVAIGLIALRPAD